VRLKLKDYESKVCLRFRSEVSKEFAMKNALIMSSGERTARWEVCDTFMEKINDFFPINSANFFQFNLLKRI
jgi:hypothetical protein